MKFFTLEWWCGLQELENYDPIPDFQNHLSSIRERLPEGLLALQETISLHDADLRSIEGQSLICNGILTGLSANKWLIDQLELSENQSKRIAKACNIFHHR